MLQSTLRKEAALVTDANPHDHADRRHDSVVVDNVNGASSFNVAQWHPAAWLPVRSRSRTHSLIHSQRSSFHLEP